MTAVPSARQPSAQRPPSPRLGALSGALLCLPLCFLLCLLPFAASACTDPGAGTDAARDEHDETPMPTNRIAVPPAVRDNLGIEFATVERRRVATTLRVPGHFELQPSARREYRMPVAGRAMVAVEPLQRVAPGDVLLRIDAPEWRRLQRELGEMTTEAAMLLARHATMVPVLAAHRAHEESLERAAEVLRDRVAGLERTAQDVGGQAGELASVRVQRAENDAALAEAAEKHAEATAMVAELEARHEAQLDRIELAIEAAASLLGTTAEALRAPTGDDDPRPRWRTLREIEVLATAPGTVDAMPLPNGAWAGIGELALATADLQRVRFVAHGLQSDLDRLRDGLPAEVQPPQGFAGEPARGELRIGADADPRLRTVELVLQLAQAPPWARPGVVGFLSIETGSSGAAEPAIPRAAVLLDGLQRIYFRRDPKDPDVVIRTEADLGVDDGRWIQVESGLTDGDQVVVAGAYELMLASAGGGRPKGGHFHADGTFHEDH